jgi:hypothetical protein
MIFMGLPCQDSTVREYAVNELKGDSVDAGYGDEERCWIQLTIIFRDAQPGTVTPVHPARSDHVCRMRCAVLSRETHFPRESEVRRYHSVEIDAAGEVMSMDKNRVHAGAEVLIAQHRLYFTTENMIQHESYILRGRQGKGDYC